MMNNDKVKDIKKDNASTPPAYNERMIRRCHIEDSDAEISRFDKAVGEAKAELEMLIKTSGGIGESVFREQLEILDDPSILNAVYDEIADQMINAEMAMAQVCDMLTGETELSPEDKVGSRNFEIRDAAERVIEIMLNGKESKKGVIDQFGKN